MGCSPMKIEERGYGVHFFHQSNCCCCCFFFFFNKKTSPLRGECRHQIGVLGEFKRGVDVAHEDWLGVREGTHLLGEHPLHPKR
ncbi:hypothetical protein Hanom_Chr10g00896971 [Helianthus anomalus]